MPRTRSMVQTRASSGVHRVRLAVMCPGPVPISSTLRGRAWESSVNTARVILTGIAADRANDVGIAEPLDDSPRLIVTMRVEPDASKAMCEIPGWTA